MVDDVYLHIGPPKTGTTYLQRVLWSNRRSLARQGIHLPGTRAGQRDAVADLRGGYWARAEPRLTWDQLVERAHRRGNTAVVSEELMAGMPDATSMARAVASLAPARVHVVCAVRDFGRGVPANYQQALRDRSSMTYEEYLASIRDRASPLWKLQDPTRLFERWKPYLAEAGHFHVITVPVSGSPHELLWRRFAGVIGADPERGSVGGDVRNDSLGVHEAELLRRFNARLGERYPLPDPYRENVTRNFIRPALRSSREAVRIGVPARHVAWVTSRSDELVESVRELQAVVDVVGDVEDLRAQITTASATGPDLTDARILETALDALIRQVEHLERRRQASTEASASRLSRAPEGAPTSSPRVVVGAARRARQAAKALFRIP